MSLTRSFNEWYIKRHTYNFLPQPFNSLFSNHPTIRTRQFDVACICWLESNRLTSLNTPQTHSTTNYFKMWRISSTGHTVTMTFTMKLVKHTPLLDPEEGATIVQNVSNLLTTDTPQLQRPGVSGRQAVQVMH